jgi:putative spermidine/putrescine transport system substrate-binding protein
MTFRTYLRVAAALLCYGLAGGPALAEDVVFGGYGGAIEQFMRDSVIPPFEKATGLHVVYVPGTALSLYSKVVATKGDPELDIYWANDLTHYAGKSQGLYARLDPRLIPNFDQLIEGARDPDGIGVIAQLSSTGIEYNTEKFKQAGWAPPTSWLDLWDPKYKGKMALYSISVFYSQEFLGVISRLSGGSETNIAPGLAKIKALRDSGNIAVFANTPAEMDNIMAQGQAWITVNGVGRALTLKQHGAPIAFVNPKEGAARYTLYLDLIRGARHAEAAQKFINWMLSADIQTKMADSIVYGPVNRNSSVPANLADEIPHGPDAFRHMIALDRTVMNRDLDDWIDRWNRQVEGRP